MKPLKGTVTEKNILTAFIGESQARNKYTYFASVAKKEGYVQISAMFEETAGQEKEHAERLFKFLESGENVTITTSTGAGIIASTAKNLEEAAAGEHYEHTEMYPSFAEIAKKEGFDTIAEAMIHIAVAELHHEKRYLAMLETINTGSVFKKDKAVSWRCRNCGYVQSNTLTAPSVCPACDHPQAYFEANCEPWFI